LAAIIARSTIKAFFRKFLRKSIASSRKWQDVGDAGFTLIELLIALAVMAIIMGVAVLAIPNHDNRYWQDNLDQLVSSLNMAQEESAMAGMPIVAQIDSVGWRFFSPGANGAMPTLGDGSNFSSSGAGNANNGSGVAIMGSSGLMPDVYRPQMWHKPIEIAALQLTLGGEQVTQALQIPIRQENRQATLLRNRNGRFTWAAGVTQ
jgi:prepilin-type N-terminal cleavage/methylation domain-containing protein